VGYLLTINKFLIGAFGLASGGYKIAGGAADVALFAQAGLSATQVAIFGWIQAAAAITMFIPAARRSGAAVLLLCNALATYGLFIAAEQPFATISIIFIVMAAVEWRRSAPSGR